MLTDEFAPLELLDLNKPLIPPRSRLYHLEPIGIGTPLVECLTSYIARLAVNHCVHSEILFCREIMSSKTSSTLEDPRYINSWVSKRQGYFNGTGNTVANLVRTIEALTCQKDLHFLSMLPWANVFSTRGLCRSHKAWCSFCYQEWHTNKQIIYDPLLWQLQEVLVCPSHKRRLDTNCPSCHQQVPLLSYRSRPGCCSNCGSSIYLSPNIEYLSSIALSQDELNQQLGLIQTIEELFAVAPCLESLPKGAVKQAFREAVNVITEGNKAAFSRLLELPKNTVWMWLSTDTLPQLGVVAKICDWLEITVADFLSLKAFRNSDRLTLNLNRNPIQRKTKKAPRRIDWDHIKKQLLLILDSEESSLPTLKETAERLEVNERSLSKHFPALCRDLTAKRTAYQQAKARKLLDECCALAKQITLEIYEEGQYPTEVLVMSRFPKPGYFRRKEVRSAFAQARQELGL